MLCGSTALLLLCCCFAAGHATPRAYPCPLCPLLQPVRSSLEADSEFLTRKASVTGLLEQFGVAQVWGGCTRGGGGGGPRRATHP
jgi:hypothetical protein